MSHSHIIDYRVLVCKELHKKIFFFFFFTMSTSGFVNKRKQNRNLTKTSTGPPALCTSVKRSFAKAGLEFAETALSPDANKLGKSWVSEGN